MSTKPYVLNCKKYTRRYKAHKLYVVVTDDVDGKPYAVQHSVSDQEWNRDIHLDSTTDWSFRGATLSLRSFGAEKTIRDLENCGRGEKTLPTIIANVLREHCGEVAKKT